MKRVIIFKFLFVFCLLLFTSGCSIDYNLTINEDSSINENIIASEQTDRMEARTKLKGEQAINYLYNMFVPNDEYSLDYKEENNTTEATVSYVYENIDEYISKFSSDVFDKINIAKDNDKITIYANQKQKLGGYGSSSLIYDEINVNIKIPFDVINSNADNVKGNVYTWNINKDSEVKTIEITYKDKSIKNKATVSINDKKYNFSYEYLILGVGVVLILSIVIFVMINNKKNNVV